MNEVTTRITIELSTKLQTPQKNSRNSRNSEEELRCKQRNGTDRDSIVSDGKSTQAG
jgi:hypothetical protein